MAVIGITTAAGAMAAASTAVAVAAAVQSSMQARKNAQAQEEAAERRNEQLVEQTIANYDELSAIELDAQQRSIDDTLSVQKEYLQNKGRINVMAAAMGTGGQSIASQLNDLEREKYSNYDTILLSRQAEQDNIRSQAETMRYQAASSMDVSPVSRPSYAATALNVGATVIGGYGSIQEVNKESELLSKQSKQTVKSGG